MEELQKRFAEEAEKYKEIQKQMTKTVMLREKLDEQLLENRSVKQELDLLDAEATVMKLVGPVLVKQSLEEARQNVQKRLEYIEGEMKRHEQTLKEYENKQQKQRDVLMEIQKTVQEKAIALQQK